MPSEILDLFFSNRSPYHSLQLFFYLFNVKHLYPTFFLPNRMPMVAYKVLEIKSKAKHTKKIIKSQGLKKKKSRAKLKIKLYLKVRVCKGRDSL